MLRHVEAAPSLNLNASLVAAKLNSTWSSSQLEIVVPSADAGIISLVVPIFKHSAQAFKYAQDKISHESLLGISSKGLTSGCVRTLP